MFRKILIANRGEIAIRVMHACRELGIATVAVYSEADKDSLHVHFADESFFIGEAAPKESYLKADGHPNSCGCHPPGYGFLSENASFARMTASAGLTFIGPSADSIRTMGDK